MRIPPIVVWLMLLRACASLDCYMKFTTLNAGDVNWNTYPDISDYYTPLINKSVDPSIQSVWLFQIKSCGYAGILLANNSDLTDVLYEIVIGSYANTKITVWESPFYRQRLETGPTLNCTAFTEFWLSWDSGGTVKLGAGDTEGINTYFTASKPGVSIGGIGVNSVRGSSGVWRYGITYSTPTPAILRTNLTTGYFVHETGIQLSALNQIGSGLRCSLTSCALICLMHPGCWYFRFDTSGLGCQQCFLYDSSVMPCLETGPVDGHLFKCV